MESARDIRRRIKSVQNTQHITSAMKMVAAAKLRRAQAAAKAARPYTKKLSQVLGRVSSAAGGGVKHPLLEVREVNKTAYIIITADRGLCGGFNANVIRHTITELRQHDHPVLIAVGRKGRAFFRRLNTEIIADYVNIGDDITFGQAKEIAQFVMDQYTDGEVDEVYLVFNEFINTLTQRPIRIKLLPVESPEQEKAEGEETKAQAAYMFEPNAESVLGELLPKYVEVNIFRALLESKAGEQGARMTAMDSATKNASEMINDLTLSLNRARQAAITKEISEIVGGAAALE